MKVAFLHVEEKIEPARSIALKMIESVKKNIPDAWLIQMTNMDTPILDGVSESRRLEVTNPFFMCYRMKHLAMLNEEALILDTDILVREDPSVVFEMPFDVALTIRDKHIISSGMGYTKNDPRMLYNTGVMFTRKTKFWQDALDECWKLEERHKHWFGDQVSVCKVVDSRKYDVAVLKCDRWNYTPTNSDEDLSGRSIIHYKGKTKKEWMLAA